MTSIPRGLPHKTTFSRHFVISPAVIAFRAKSSEFRALLLNKLIALCAPSDDYALGIKTVTRAFLNVLQNLHSLILVSVLLKKLSKEIIIVELATTIHKISYCLFEEIAILFCNIYLYVAGNGH